MGIRDWDGLLGLGTRLTGLGSAGWVGLLACRKGRKANVKGAADDDAAAAAAAAAAVDLDD